MVSLGRLSKTPEEIISLNDYVITKFQQYTKNLRKIRAKVKRGFN